MKLYSASDIVKLMEKQSFTDWYEEIFIPYIEGEEALGMLIQ